jgi:spore maturation protein CgeB
MGYDEVEHHPRLVTQKDLEVWSSDVVFVGSWMPERSPFLRKLQEQGVPLTIIGDHWQKAHGYPTLRDVWRRSAVYGADYSKAIQCSKIALGLLSKGNRDLHTTRSFEIPALGGLLCAERTSEHLQVFNDGTEAVFWRDAEECARHCVALLNDQSRRRAIAQAGSVAVRRNALGNEAIARDIISRLSALLPLNR